MCKDVAADEVLSWMWTFVPVDQSYIVSVQSVVFSRHTSSVSILYIIILGCVTDVSVMRLSCDRRKNERNDAIFDIFHTHCGGGKSVKCPHVWICLMWKGDEEHRLIYCVYYLMHIFRFWISEWNWFLVAWETSNQVGISDFRIYHWPINRLNNLCPHVKLYCRYKHVYSLVKLFLVSSMVSVWVEITCENCIMT